MLYTSFWLVVHEEVLSNNCRAVLIYYRVSHIQLNCTMIYSESCISVYALDLMLSQRLKTTNITKINQYETVIGSVNTHQPKATRNFCYQESKDHEEEGMSRKLVKGSCYRTWTYLKSFWGWLCILVCFLCSTTFCMLLFHDKNIFFFYFKAYLVTY